VKITSILCDTAPRIFLEIKFAAIALMMEVESISETSVNVHETIRRSITEGSYLQETSVT
jgi:hypothetical protein